MRHLASTALASLAAALFGSAAMAADLSIPAAPMAPAPAASSWNGPYVGAHAGYTWGTVSSSLSGAGLSWSGAELGGVAGYDTHVSDNIVVGIEGDINWRNESLATSVGNTLTPQFDASLRGRLGLDLGQIMPYVEAGVAYEHLHDSAPADPVPDGNFVGWTVGGGVEAMLTDHLSGNLEVRYTNFGSQPMGTSPNKLSDSETAVLVGANYHF